MTTNNIRMINASELRLGNFILFKNGPKISAVACGFSQLELLAKDPSLFFAVKLKPEHFEKCGFIENTDYALLPDAREFILTLPVHGNNANEIYGYMKNNRECFARATVNKQPVSVNVFHLHGLQNLYFALTGKEMEVKF